MVFSRLALLSLFTISTFVDNTEALNNFFQYIPPPGYYGYGYGPGPVPPIPPPYGYGYPYGYPCKKREAGFKDQPKEKENVVLPTLNE
ncbi:hypothetical protein Aduo_016624 [Ancylostoma duodenale]